MKTILLMRHAKSDWGDADTADHDRPLSARGHEDAPRMGRVLKRLDLVPGVIVTSPAARARETAERVAKAAGYSGGIVTVAGLYASGGEAWIEAARSIPEAVASALLVAHAPGVEEAAALLVGRGGRRTEAAPRVRVPTAGLLRVDLAVDRWRDTSPGCGVLAWFLTPKLVKAMD